MAKWFLSICTREKEPYNSPKFIYEKSAIYVDGVKSSCVDEMLLYEVMKGKTSKEYWENHHSFHITRPWTFDWEACKHATTRLQTGYRRFYTKFVSGHIRNRYKLHQQGHADKVECPNCKKDRIEKSSHVLRCSNLRTRILFQKRMKDFKKEMKNKETSPRLWKLL